MLGKGDSDNVFSNAASWFKGFFDQDDDDHKTADPISQPSVNFFGPLLRFHDLDQARAEWKGSVLIVARSRPVSPPTLRYGPRGARSAIAPVRELFALDNNVFYRYELTVELGRQESAVAYSIDGTGPHVFHVPALGADARVMAMSCNGFSSDVENPAAAGGVEPLWNDALRRHAEKPFHVLIGGGDQLYSDPIFTSNDEILAWLRIDGRDNKMRHPFDLKMQRSVERFYFNNYIKCFSQPSMKEAFATIPYVFQWDDHDIFDGWGSYPSWLADSAVFHGIYTSARHYYLLFQQHTVDANRRMDEPHVFGANLSFSTLKHLGPSTAVLGVDTRTERTLDRIASEETWQQVEAVLESRLSPTVKHLVVSLAIPVVWPRLSTADMAVDALGDFLSFASDKLNFFDLGGVPAVGGIGEAIGKTGLYKSVMGVFGEPELADDLCDHWTSEKHETERLAMILRFQNFSQKRGVRITLLSGDVHCCGVGWFRPKEVPFDASRDARVMYQIVSSAIVNVPPPGVVINMLHKNAGPYDLDNATCDELLPVFKQDVDGTPLDDNSNKVLPRRNYASFETRANGELAWNIYLERVDRNADAMAVEVVVPALRRKEY
ncbi:hypothetical protein HDU86_002038 [Geranomyces michiganensis]|nr:hypothetical protein HDU86_002038 [Geranomyces michiganensis]